MRVLVVHNHYQTTSPSGENTVFRTETALLRSAGVDVVTFERANDGISADWARLAGTALEALWSRRTYRDLGEVLRRVRPDVAHFHNFFPRITWSAHLACRDASVPVVQTLHNYRLLCLNGMLLRNGRPCETCVGRSVGRGVVHRCYRGSLAASVVAYGATMAARMRGDPADLVNRYIALTDSARARFIRGGLPASKFTVRGNCLSIDPGFGTGTGSFALYVGRLSAEKGVLTLLDAWRRLPDVPLVVAGDGPLRHAMQNTKPPNVTLLGALPREEVMRLMREARLMVIPSECYEGFPLVLVEAFATGLPVIAADIGALQELVVEQRNGLLFPPRHAAALAQAVARAWGDEGLLRSCRALNRRLFETTFSPSAGLESLLRIYESVRSER